MGIGTTHGTVPRRLTHVTGTLDLHLAHGSSAPGPPLQRPTHEAVRFVDVMPLWAGRGSAKKSGTAHGCRSFDRPPSASPHIGRSLL
jgi:hypothetical protein